MLSLVSVQAIRDDVIEAELDHAAGTLTSREAANVYATREPQDAFARRIGFLLDVHAEAVRDMRYPPGAHREDLETAEQRREREKEEAAFAAAVEDGEVDEGDDDDMMD